MKRLTLSRLGFFLFSGVWGDESARGQYLENYSRYANEIFTGSWYGKTEKIALVLLWQQIVMFKKVFLSGLFFSFLLTYSTCT